MICEKFTNILIYFNFFVIKFMVYTYVKTIPSDCPRSDEMSVFRTQHMAVAWHEMTDEESVLPAVRAPLKEKAALIGRVGLMMLSSGTAAWRVRASINKLSRGLGVVTNADIGLLTLNYTCFEDGEQATYCISLNTTGVNTTKIYAMKEFTDRFSEKAEEYSAGQFHNILDKIESLPENYKPWQTGLAAAAACAAFAFLLGGGPVEMFCAFFGAGLGAYLGQMQGIGAVPAAHHYHGVARRGQLSGLILPNTRSIAYCIKYLGVCIQFF